MFRCSARQIAIIPTIIVAVFSVAAFSRCSHRPQPESNAAPRLTPVSKRASAVAEIGQAITDWKYIAGSSFSVWSENLSAKIADISATANLSLQPSPVQAQRDLPPEGYRRIFAATRIATDWNEQVLKQLAANRDLRVYYVFGWTVGDLSYALEYPALIERRRYIHDAVDSIERLLAYQVIAQPPELRQAWSQLATDIRKSNLNSDESLTLERRLNDWFRQIIGTSHS